MSHSQIIDFGIETTMVLEVPIPRGQYILVVPMPEFPDLDRYTSSLSMRLLAIPSESFLQCEAVDVFSRRRGSFDHEPQVRRIFSVTETCTENDWRIGVEYVRPHSSVVEFL